MAYGIIQCTLLLCCDRKIVSYTSSNSYLFNFTSILPHKQTTIKTTQLQASHAFIWFHAILVHERNVRFLLRFLKLNGQFQSTHGNLSCRNLLFLSLRRLSCVEIGMVRDQLVYFPVVLFVVNLR